jgi:hypothetical protein
MEPESSLPSSQQPATGPCPEPDESSPHLPTLFPQSTAVWEVWKELWNNLTMDSFDQ